MNKVVVAGLIRNHQGLFLISQRRSDSHAEIRNKWEFPGGKVEPGETEQEALAREIMEENGVNITVGDFVIAYPGFYTWCGDFQLRYYHAEIAPDQLPRSIQCQNVAFASFKELVMGSYDLIWSAQQLVIGILHGRVKIPRPKVVTMK